MKSSPKSLGSLKASLQLLGGLVRKLEAVPAAKWTPQNQSDVIRLNPLVRLANREMNRINRQHESALEKLRARKTSRAAIEA